MKPALDLRLYAIADPAVSPAERLSDLVAATIAGGTTLVQLRDKHGDTRTLIAQAEALLAVTRPGNVPLLINDRVDVALAVGAEGVHLGQDDMPARTARRLLGPDAIIGLTIKNENEVAAAPLDVVDYLAIGGVFATTSKDNPAPPIGLNGLKRIAAASRARRPNLALCAIAGITAETAGAVVEAGVDGVSIISALFRSADPEGAARALLTAVDRALEQRSRA